MHEEMTGFGLKTEFIYFAQMLFALNNQMDFDPAASIHKDAEKLCQTKMIEKSNKCIVNLSACQNNSLPLHTDHVVAFTVFM